MPYLGPQSRVRGATAPFICIRRYVCNGRPYPPSHNARRMHYACFAPFWRFGKSRWVSPRPVRRLFLLARAGTSMRASARVFSSAREGASQLERECAPRSRLDWAVAGGSYFYRHDALCSAERIADRSLRSDAPEDSISAIAVVLEINRGGGNENSHAELITGKRGVRNMLFKNLL